ncbi:MAG: L-aspartate oxidase [Acidobacteriota bacterium]
MHDYIIIGSGIAGLFTALLASKHGSVLVLTKSALEESNTRYAQGGIAAAISPEDSPRLHYDDTVSAGAGLCYERAVEVLTREAPGRIRDLLNLKVPFDRHDGELALGLEAAHRARRVLHAGGDATGYHIEHSLSRALRDAGASVIEGCFVTQIVIEEGRATGVRTLAPAGNDKKLGDAASLSMLHRGRHIVLASGGAGQLFSHTTNPQVATGDGLALAYRAGAELADLEFYQFHPTALAIPGFSTFLISEAVRGEGAYLRNTDGERFMLRIDSRGELAPRDVVARAIAAEMQRSGTTHVWLDLSHLPKEMVKRRFPTIDAYCRGAGLDMTTDPLPVAPAAHYLMGGVRTNLWGETNLPGLYACGEVACTGVHGANRLASNSLLEGIVFGARIVERTTSSAERDDPGADVTAIRISDPVPSCEKGSGVGQQSLPALQELMWDRVGLVRDEAGLHEAQIALTALLAEMSEPRTASEHELANMIMIGILMATAAVERRESRGGHHRSDFPDTDPQWRRHIVLSKTAAARCAREVK